MRFFQIFTILALSALVSCSAADVVRLVKNVKLEDKGIHVKFAYVPPGLHQKPLAIKFDKMLRDISNGTVQVMAYNIYTAGNYDAIHPRTKPDISNFYDPESKFKDAWFGVYIIIDDTYRLGRRFILKNPYGEPDDLSNLNDRSLVLLPNLDQKLIVWTTHQGQMDYTWLDLDREFYFTLKKGTTPMTETKTDRAGRSWRKITGDFDTIAALTDINKTNMKLFSSIRNLVGLPDAGVYSRVDPWHPVVIRGSVLARYFRCSDTCFWAVVYYNGSAFTTKDGRRVDTWEQTDLRSIYSRMFDAIEIDCAAK
jgi:hypothetical protein